MNDFSKSWLCRAFSNHERFVSNSGERCVPVYGLKEVTAGGTIILKKTGERDLFAEIQSHKDSCDLNIIIDRIRNGDLYAVEKLRARETFYADCEQFPKTYQEMLNVVMNAESIFEQLSVDEKQKYGNNFRTWLMQLDGQNMSVDTEKVMSTDKVESTKSSAADSPAATE